MAFIIYYCFRRPTLEISDYIPLKDILAFLLQLTLNSPSCRKCTVCSKQLIDAYVNRYNDILNAMQMAEISISPST